MTTQQGPAHARYEKLSTDRNTYLRRARAAAALTIPSLMPPEGHNGNTEYVTPYQSMGSRGVNTLAAKLLLALLPANTPFFRLTIDDFSLEKLANDEEARAGIEEAFNKIERAVMSDIETTSIRPSLMEALKQLIIAGNALLFLDKATSAIKVYRLDRYVVKRDGMGNVMEIITKEDIDPLTLSEEDRSALELAPKDDGTFEDVQMYTQVRFDGAKWTVFQEVKGLVVPNSVGTYPKTKSPWLPLRFTKVDFEDYGRGYVEEFIGDLQSLEGLTKAVVQGSAAAAKILFLVKPNGSTKIKDIEAAPNGSVRTGDAEDVSTLQMNKFADFQVAKASIDAIGERLAYAFMLNKAIQRQGERVTAEEIRYMAGELDDSLGGIYSILSQELQLPLVSLKMKQMASQNRLPSLPEGIVKPAIVTGVQALGRGHDLDNLRGFVNDIVPMAQADAQILDYINFADALTRIGTSRGIDMSGLIRKEEEVQQLRQQRQAEQMGPEMMKQMMSQGGQPNG